MKGKAKIITALFILLSSVSVISADNLPEFPMCSNAPGQLIASYDYGIHGIPGSSNVYRGSDRVYLTSDNTVVQCFCPEEGFHGIQTNWWKIGQMSENEINNYKSQGWIYIPSGKDWGLDDAIYLAKNIDYNCGGGSNPTPTPTPESTVTPTPTTGITSTPTPGPTATPTDAPKSDNNIGGQVLAATGGSYWPYLLLLVGIIAQIAGYLILRQYKTIR